MISSSEARQALLLEQPLRLHCFLDRRAGGDAGRVALKRRPLAHVELEQVRPTENREEIGVGNREFISRQVRFAAELLHQKIAAPAEQGDLVVLPLRRDLGVEQGAERFVHLREMKFSHSIRR